MSIGKKYQSKEFSQDQVKQAYVNYLYESMSRSTSSQESLSNTSQWKEVKTRNKVEFSESKVEK